MARLVHPEWKEFEVAVAHFVQALAPNSMVRHNLFLPDKHTGLPRQRDVWIEAKICNHFPIKVYISCKRTTRKLSQQDIDAFNGELISSGAQKGVIYSFRGFTKPAVQKAKELEICCCRLYHNSPPDLPKVLVFHGTYIYRPTIQLLVSGYPASFKTWNEILCLNVLSDGQQKKAIDVIGEKYLKSESEAASCISPGIVGPPDWSDEIVLHPSSPEMSQFNVTIMGRWKVYRGKLNAYLINGSYSFTENEFIGSQTTPVIDTQGTSPGPDWELLPERPQKDDGVRLIFFGSSVNSILQNNVGPQVLHK